MIPLLALMIVVFGILGFRIYRLVHYYKEANNNPNPEERRIAYTSYIIHLIFCLILFVIISLVIYGYVLMSNGEV